MSDKNKVKKVFFSLGSNLFDREANLRKAVAELHGFIDNIRVSSIFETTPLYVVDQPLFLNIVVSGATNIECRDLLAKTKDIEQLMGRDIEHARSKGPRIIDIDIILYDASIIREKDLEVPHPGIAERRFVLVPLLELAGDVIDPRTGIAFSDILEKTDDRTDQSVRLYSNW
jgi:2-amino-4-hydroxy-6-hydroxymethyldihydropteridine diphosphokinase